LFYIILTDKVIHHFCRQ